MDSTIDYQPGAELLQKSYFMLKNDFFLHFLHFLGFIINKHRLFIFFKNCKFCQNSMNSQEI